MSNILTNISNNIKDIRLNLNMTQKAFADIISKKLNSTIISPIQICQWEKGTRNIPLDVLITIYKLKKESIAVRKDFSLEWLFWDWSKPKAILINKIPNSIERNTNLKTYVDYYLDTHLKYISNIDKNDILCESDSQIVVKYNENYTTIKSSFDLYDYDIYMINLGFPIYDFNNKIPLDIKYPN